MHHATAKRLARYFDNPPAVDWIDAPGRRVLACPIEASPYWQNPQTLLAEQLCAAQRVKDARLRRHEERLAAEENDVDHVERAVDVAPPRVFKDETPPAKRNAKPVRFTPREFRRKMDPVAIAMDAAERNQRIALYQNAARMMWQGADWDASLEIAGPKIADQLLYMCERLLFNVQSALKAAAEQLAAVSRQTIGDEIPRQQLERLEWKIAGLRVQERHYELMAYAFKVEHERAVRIYEHATDRKWGAYEGIKARAERSARAYRSKVRQRTSVSMVIENMSDAEYAKWVDNTKRYEPKRNGVDASEEVTGVDTTDWHHGDVETFFGDEE